MHAFAALEVDHLELPYACHRGAVRGLERALDPVAV